MKYDRTTPCDNCPFRRRGHIKLSAARVREISRCVLGNPGGTFPCHKTTTAGGASGRDQQHCAGALLYAETQGKATPLTRIAEHLGIYNPRALLAAGHAPEVFDCEKDMARAHRTAVPL